MSTFKFKGVVYCYTTMVSKDFIDDFNKNAKNENCFTMYGDCIYSYKGRIYCKETEDEIWETEVLCGE